MPCEFRFLVMCLTPTKRDGVVTLSEVVNTLYVPKSSLPTDIRMHAVVGAVLRSPMWGKNLDLMAWQLGNKGERETLVKYRGTPLILPREVGRSMLTLSGFCSNLDAGYLRIRLV